MKILVTGAAGFIGYHLCKTLLTEGHEVHGIDNLNDYYDIQLKKARLNELGHNGFYFHQIDLADSKGLFAILESFLPDIIINLAAQAGVRHSITNPQAFIDSNIQGFFNVLEGCRKFPVKHFIYASSSSVYGTHAEIPFRETARTDQPVSLYGATKKAGEVLAHSYVELYKIPSTGLRFFTVYGPWGRPDMAYFKFADQIMNGETIDIYNNGKMERDFTYVDDIIRGIISLLEKTPSQSSESYHQILNIGRSSPVNLLLFVELLEKHLGRKANKNYLPMQPGEIQSTWADTTALRNLTGYSPGTDLEEGIRSFVDWYKSYHGIS